jgi:hypothetical protein
MGPGQILLGEVALVAVAGMSALVRWARERRERVELERRLTAAWAPFVAEQGLAGAASALELRGAVGGVPVTVDTIVVCGAVRVRVRGRCPGCTPRGWRVRVIDRAEAGDDGASVTPGGGRFHERFTVEAEPAGAVALLDEEVQHALLRIPRATLFVRRDLTRVVWPAEEEGAGDPAASLDAACRIVVALGRARRLEGPYRS